MKGFMFLGCQLLASLLLVAAEDETAAWQGRIDFAAKAGGGVVSVPSGRHLVGQLDLKSNVELRLEKGAVLEGLVGLEHYRVTTLPYSEGTWSAIVSAIGVTNVAITGEGEIFGNGKSWKIPEDYGGNQEGLRARGIFFADSERIRLSGFTLRDAACWGVVFKCCRHVRIKGVTIDNHANSNNDGFDIEASDVVIEDCDVDAGDDAYCLKSNNPHFTVENVTVRNCIARSHSNGCKIGTATHGTIRNVLFEKIVCAAPRRDFIDNRKSSPNFGKPHFYRPELLHLPAGGGLGAVTIECVDGGRVENVIAKDVKVSGFIAPIFVRAGTRTGRDCGTPPGNQYMFRNIRIENVHGQSETPIASSISGVDGCRVKDVVLKDIDIVCPGADAVASRRALETPVPDVSGLYPECTMFRPSILPAYGLYVDRVDGILLENVRFRLKEGSGDVRPPVFFSRSVRREVPAEDSAKPARKVLNVVNFVRSLDPRISKTELVRALDEEVKLNLRYGFPNTVLLQYDALVDDEMLATARRSDPAKTEYGLWFEMSRPLNEAAGLEWRPSERHKDWNWDWFINPGFLMAYDQSERRRLIDAAFAKFREVFGDYPKSVGSWLLDAYSMDYMVERYGVDGFCICREQDSTDAYGLRGGYSNGAYYPSRRNMLSAAVEMKNAIRAPVFKMLTPDPIYNYGKPNKLYADYPFAKGCPTLEPVWKSGYDPQIVDWFFRVYTESPGLLNLSYLQTGQENSFGWNEIVKGWPMQCAKIAALRDIGRIEVETMGETARRFKSDHPSNCPQTQVALEDWNGGRRKSIWYNSRFYRANLILEDGRLFFRDIHKMADDFEEPFLEKKCTGWQALYFTPPVVDQWLFRGAGASGVMAISGKHDALSVTTEGDSTLVVTSRYGEKKRASLRFEEGKIVVRDGSLSAEYEEEFSRDLRVLEGSVEYSFSDYRYQVPIVGSLRRTTNGFSVGGSEIVLDMTWNR